MKAALESVLLYDLLLELLNRLHLIFIDSGTFQLSCTLIWVIVDFQNLIHMMVIVL